MGAISSDERGLIAPCPSCGQRNRLRYEKLSDPPRCAKCGTALSLPAEPIDLANDDAFDALIARSPLPVMVDFWAEWCGPCKMIAPILDDIAKEYTGRLKIAKLNIDENLGTPPKYGIRGIPTLMLFKNGNVEATKVGAVSKSQLAAFIDSNI